METIDYQHQPEHPVEFIPSDDPGKGPSDGIALCLSGGGYRAMMFHVGAVLRLHEAGLLSRLDRVSSVSGGSITAAVLALWMRDAAQGGQADILAGFVEPIRRLAGHTIDRGAILGGVFLPGSVADRVERAYRKRLFGDATLQDLPDEPRFVFNATNVQSGALWRFSKPYMADWRVGVVPNPTVSLAKAVAASSAFPPVLSPVELELEDSDYKPGSGSGLQRAPFTTDVTLTDGGVYDNLGLETAWKNFKTVLVSDGGGKMPADPDPNHGWAGHTRRVLSVIDNQVRSLRKRQLIGSYVRGDREGAYWGIRTEVGAYGLADALPCPSARTRRLAMTPTRLKKLKAKRQERLINWGYAVCDAAVRTHVDSELAAPTGFPYPDSAV